MQNPSGIRIPSTPGRSPPGVEQFYLRTPANAADPGGEVDKVDALEKKVKELEKKVMLLEAMIQEFIQGQDPWQQCKIGESDAVDQQAHWVAYRKHRR